MSLFEVGRLAVKLAGRDAGKTCIVIKVIDDNFVMIDGQTRRRKCNTKHLEPLNTIIKINKDASHADITAEFKKLKLKVLETKPKEKKERAKKQRKEKIREAKEKKNASKEEKKPIKKKDAAEEPISKAKLSSFEETIEQESQE